MGIDSKLNYLTSKERDYYTLAAIFAVSAVVIGAMYGFNNIGSILSDIGAASSLAMAGTYTLQRRHVQQLNKTTKTETTKLEKPTSFLNTKEGQAAMRALKEKVDRVTNRTFSFVADSDLASRMHRLLYDLS